MSSVYLVSFATTTSDFGYPDMTLYQERLIRSARSVGITNFLSWTRSQIKQTEFYDRHRNILDRKRGAGLCLWKPYIILEALLAAADGDYIIYSDATCVFHAPVDSLLAVCHQNGGFFLVGQDSLGKNYKYVKKDAFVLMNCDSEEFYDAPMTEAFFQIYEKNSRTVSFVKEYLEACTVPEIISDTPSESKVGEHEGFVVHKYDMAVLSLLRLKHSLPVVRNPSQWGNHRKTIEYRKTGEWLQYDGYFDVLENSPYDTVIGWRENQKGIVRSWKDRINPVWLYHRLKRMLHDIK